MKLVNKVIQIIKKAMQNPKLFVLDVVIAGLVVLFLMISVMAVGEFYSSVKYSTHDENNFYYRLEAEDYPTMVTYYHQNVAAGLEDKKDLQEYYGVAKYYEAAADYKLYTEAGETAKAQAQKTKMDEAYEQMGDFQFVSENIDEDLGL